MNGFQLYALGVLSPIAALGLVGLGAAAVDAIKNAWRGRQIAVGAVVQCREWHCGYTATSWRGRGQKRNARQMLREHMQSEHHKEAS
jgi:hypothetical protein